MPARQDPKGREHGFAARNTADWSPLDELRRKQRVLDDWYIAWSDRLTQFELERKVHFAYSGRRRSVMTCAEIALHLANHTSYHRGYIADMFFHVPVHPLTIDLTVFIRDVPLKLDRPEASGLVARRGARPFRPFRTGDAPAVAVRHPFPYTV